MMGRSVSYPSDAVVAFRTLEIEDEDNWEWEYEYLVEEIIETARSTFPSLEPCDGWRGREDQGSGPQATGRGKGDGHAAQTRVPRLSVGSGNDPRHDTSV